MIWMRLLLQGKPETWVNQRHAGTRKDKPVSFSFAGKHPNWTNPRYPPLFNYTKWETLKPSDLRLGNINLITSLGESTWLLPSGDWPGFRTIKNTSPLLCEGQVFLTFDSFLVRLQLKAQTPFKETGYSMFSTTEPPLYALKGAAFVINDFDQNRTIKVDFQRWPSHFS